MVKKRISKKNYEEMIDSLENNGYSTKQIADIMNTFSKDDLLAGEQEKRKWRFDGSDMYVVRPTLSYTKHKTGNNTKPQSYYDFKKWVEERINPIFEEGRKKFMVQL